MKIHPLAARFGQLPPDEFQTLVEDIRENGLRFPISTAIVDGEEVVIDGANRQAACEMAGVAPRYERLNGVDVRAFIQSANLTRRHWSTGQRAMMIAEMFPESEGSGRDDPASDLTKSGEVHGNRVREARLVLRYAPQLVDRVLFDDFALSKAYAAAQAAKKQAEEADAEAAADRERRDELRRKYPDLAKLVEDNALTLEGGEAEAAIRDERAKQKRLTIFRAVKNAVEGLALLAFESDDLAKMVHDHADDFAAVNSLGAEYLAGRAEHAQAGARKLVATLTAIDWRKLK
jgi:hypothetical protein